MSGEGVLDKLTLHQLLGRIVYFHVLLIAPDLPAAARAPVSGPACCHHRAPGSRSPETVLAGSAWGALLEVAAELPDRHRPCPRTSGTCCAACRVTSAASAVGSGWAAAEHRAYHPSSPEPEFLDACGRAAASRVGRVFAARHATSCAALDRLTAEPSAPEALPGVDELPLTGELLALWADPTATTQAPVASWLNHCTGGLGDVRRVLESRRNPS
ncbi:hypothetical protein [Streptomyces microflavus]|uniref:hypothetical protein n=1 Tax=Streptomyces microflavus TaxID=1919 RepID=UPI002E340D7D|nr:hypothetical protein [Streptomyces microflavus]